MKILKIQITKAEVNGAGYEKINKTQQTDTEGMMSREYWENLNIQPTKDNCYDFEDSEENILLDSETHFNFWISDFYFKLEDFKYLELDQQETGLVAILTLKDDTEYALTEASAHYLKGVIENL